MATIRDVVEALARRGGVDAVVVVGRDGLPIDARAANGVDAENVAALLPSVINGLAQLGEAGGRGEFGTGVLEFGSGLAVVSVLNADALLIVLVRPSTNVGALLDALLLDLHLPDGSGLDLLHELRAATATRALPVIVLTAEGEDRILRAAEGLGAALLTKPFSPSKLTARVAAMLGDAPPQPPRPAPSVPQDPR